MLFNSILILLLSTITHSLNSIIFTLNKKQSIIIFVTSSIYIPGLIPFSMIIGSFCRQFLRSTILIPYISHYYLTWYSSFYPITYSTCSNISQHILRNHLTRYSSFHPITYLTHLIISLHISCYHFT